MATGSSASTATPHADHPAHGWWTPWRVALVAACAMVLLALGARLHATLAQARVQGGMALALLDAAPMAEDPSQPPRALSQAMVPAQAIRALSLCDGGQCRTVYTQPDAQPCEGGFAWPAACVSVRAADVPSESLVVAWDVRPAILAAGFDALLGLGVLGAAMWAWQRRQPTDASAVTVQDAAAPRAPARPVAETDPLTGLLNRVAFEAALKRHNEAESIGALETDGCLMYFDLDRFKFINDTHGHIAGDVVLKTVAQRLRYTLGGGVLIGRLGGDEFAALVTDVSSRATIETMCRVLIEQVSKPILIGDIKEWVGLSIGAYMLKRGSLNLGEMLHRADLAMYEAKRTGRGRLVFYDDSMDEAARSRAQVQADLKAAIDARQFFMVYQPQFDMADRVRGIEAMVRWQHPVRGVIPPEQFIPVAEQSGLSVALGKAVIDIVCTDLVAMRAQHVLVPYISMDVSLRQLADAAMVEDVQALLARHGLSSDDLEFEVTENSAVPGQAGKENAVLQRLSAMSFRIAIDDFGSGCASLGRLMDLKVDKLKIDAMFVQGIGQPYFNSAVLEMMIQLSNRLGIKSVAEGVETVEQVAWLRQAGCKMMQGRFFCEPMPHAKLVQWLKTQDLDMGDSPNNDHVVWAPTQTLDDVEA
jgi:diguanylate cyclase (GGDEF)-like protein